MGVDLNVEEHLMAGREGIIVRALGDGQQYVVQLTQGLPLRLIAMTGHLPSAAQHADMAMRSMHGWQCGLCLLCFATLGV